jgi:hypothetical protein
VSSLQGRARGNVPKSPGAHDKHHAVAYRAQ